MGKPKNIKQLEHLTHELAYTSQETQRGTVYLYEFTEQNSAEQFCSDAQDLDLDAHMETMEMSWIVTIS